MEDGIENDHKGGNNFKSFSNKSQKGYKKVLFPKYSSLQNGPSPMYVGMWIYRFPIISTFPFPSLNPVWKIKSHESLLSKTNKD